MADSNDNGSETKEKANRLVYGIPDYPPIHLGVIFCLQQVMLTLSGIMVVPIIISQYLGEGREQDEDYQQELLLLRAQLVGITVFVCGVSTLLQTTVGIRLPLIQGSSYTFLPVIKTIFSLKKFHQGVTVVNGSTLNTTVQPEATLWKLQLSELSGSLMAASAFQVIVGATGLVGFLAKFMGPLTLTPIMALIALSFLDALAFNSSYHWGIAIMTVGLLIIFSEMLPFKLPLPTWSRKKGCHSLRLPVFKLMPVFFSLFFAWGLCAILTATNVLPNDKQHANYQARTDAKIHIVKQTDWITLPYPGRWGPPTISWASFIGMLMVTLSSIIESIGDYYAAAGLCQAPPPPHHATNRGILFEGFGCFIGGFLYAGHGSTSYSGNIGSISLTRVGSRIIFQACGAVMILLGLFGKFGAALATIPEPVMAGLLFMLISLILGISMSYLRHVNMNKSRNLTVVGFSILAGTVIPRWVRLPGNENVFNTGSSEFDQVLKILLGTEIIFGGMLALILDLILPGSRKDRGIDGWHNVGSGAVIETYKHTEAEIYGFWDCCKCKSPACCKYVPVWPDSEFKTDQAKQAERSNGPVSEPATSSQFDSTLV